MDQSLLFLLLGKESPWLPWILLASFLFTKLPTLQSFVHRWCFAWRAEYEVSGTFYIDKRRACQSGSFSNEMQALLYYLHQNKSSLLLSNARVISTDGLALTVLCESIACPGDTYGVYLTPHIYARFHYMESTNSGCDSGSDKVLLINEVKMQVRLTSWKGQDVIHQFVQSIVAVLEKAKTISNEKLYVVKPSLTMDDSSGHGSKYIPFNTSNTFDSLFFDEKDRLLQRLKAFQDKEGLSKRLGLPSTLGLLLYGEPGTGKTSTIKAIANHMRMSLIVVPMNKIKTRHDLEAVFYDKNVCWIDYSKRIYVLEEVDCNGWEKIVCPRSKPSDDWDMGLLDDLSKSSDPLERRKALSMIDRKARQEEDKLTLGAILEVLDGIVETPGRIVIMTTNHQCELDPALIRPGRIDMQIEFRRLSREQVGLILEKAFEHPIPSCLLKQLPDRKLTQAELAQILWNNKDYSECLKSLMALSD